MEERSNNLLSGKEKKNLTFIQIQLIQINLFYKKCNNQFTLSICEQNSYYYRNEFYAVQI